MAESDSIERFLEKNLSIQEKLLDFLDDEENSEENFRNLNQLFKDTQIRNCPHELRLFLHLLVKISNNHHRGVNFFSKITQILSLFKEDLQKYTNVQLFNLFKSNKRLLLFLIEEGIMSADEYFAKQIIEKKYLDKKYPQYFQPEIEPFIYTNWFPKYDPESSYFNIWVEEVQNEIPENFNEFRYKGENENYICKLIREDLVEDFISHVSESNIKHDTIINPSIYETNSFLIKGQIPSDEGITLIEYAAFFGSIKIFNFLRNQGAKITPSLWLYAIHGKNSGLIHILEGSGVKPVVSDQKNLLNPKIKSFKGCFKESLKCHYNDIANYFQNNHLQDEDDVSYYTITQSLKYYNFSFLQNECIDEKFIFDLCHYDYYYVVNFLLANKNIDINSQLNIKNYIF